MRAIDSCLITAQLSWVKKVMAFGERPVQSTPVGVKSTMALMGTAALGLCKMREGQTPRYPKDIVFSLDENSRPS